jgi:hypothetical protein
MKKPLKQIQSTLTIFFDYGKTVTLGFLNEKEVQEYAPGSAFEGKWKLKEPNIKYLYQEVKNLIYLLAKSAE